MLTNTSEDIKKFSYKLPDYISWLHEFARAVGCKARDNTVSFSGAGEGTSTAYVLEKGLTACVNNYQLYEDYLLTRQPSDNYGVIIYLYHLQTLNPVEYKLGNLSVNVDIGSNCTLNIINAQTSHQIIFHKTTLVEA